jgi:hypothetical protein
MLSITAFTNYTSNSSRTYRRNCNCYVQVNIYHSLTLSPAADGCDVLGVTDGAEGTADGRTVGNDGIVVGSTVGAPTDNRKYNSGYLVDDSW